MAAELNRALLEELLEEGLDDWVPLISVASAVVRHVAPAAAEICPHMASTTLRLLDEGLFRAGTVSEESGFAPVQGPVADKLDSICADWTSVDEGDWWWALWLEITDRGRAEAHARFPHIADGSSGDGGQG